MSNNVLINGRTAVHAGSGGILTTVDICKTQIGPAVVPIPYTNVAQSSDAAGTAATVFINGHPVCTKSSCFSKSTGDEAGDKGGISSGTIQGKAEFLSASPNVFIEGVAAVRQGDLMVSNNQNTAPAPLVQPGAPPPSQVMQTAQEAKNPSPEPCRVALEIAGDRLDQLKGEIIAKKEGDVIKGVPLGRRSEIEGHRREVFLEGIPEGEYDLVLHQIDAKQAAYQTPLAQSVPTCPREESPPDQWETVYIPVLPRTFRTPESDRAQAGYLRHSEDMGWVYVFVNGRLWRELKVEKAGYFRDVNLTYEKGRDQRPATISTCDNRILVPYTIQGEAVELEMAYSEVQWSWARIDAMGGMAEDDPRQEHGGAISPGDDSEDAAQLRSRRLQKIDLSSYPDFDQDEGVSGPADQFEPPLRYDLAIHRESKIPVVYLQDPLGVARNLHQAMTDAYGRYAQHLEKNAHPKVIADIAEAVLVQHPEFKEHLREEQRESFLKEFSRTEEQLTAAFEETHKKYLDYRERDNQDIPLTVRIVQQDFNLKCPSHQMVLEEFELTMAAIVGANPRGRQYLARMMEDPGSGLSKALELSGKATAFTTALLNTVAAPLETMKDGLERLSDILEIRYGLKLDTAEMSITEWLRLYCGGTQSMAPANVMPVPVGLQRLPSGASVGIKGLTVNEVNLSEWADKVAGSRSLAKLVFALEAFNLLQGLRQTGDHLLLKDYEWTLSQALVSFTSMFSSGFATASAYRGVQEALLRRAGNQAKAKALRMAAFRLGTIAAFVGAASDITQAYQKHQAGDVDARNSYLFSAGGGLIAATGGIILLTLGAKTTAAGAMTSWTPVGWVLVAIGTAISIGGAASLLWTENSPLENWLLHCYWGQQGYQGEGHVQTAQGEIFEDYTQWQNNPDLELESYCRLVYQFRATLSWGPERATNSTIHCHGEKLTPGVTLTVEVPNGADRSQIFVHMRARLREGTWKDLISKDFQPFWRRSEPANQPVSLMWNFKESSGFGSGLPAGVEQVEATAWFDPFGDGYLLRPDASGLQLKVGLNDRHEKTV